MDVATALQTKLAVQKVGTTCTYAGGKFVITSPTTGIASTITVASADNGGLAAAIGMLAAVLVQGTNEESPVDALNACEQVTGSFYGIAIDTEYDDTDAAYDVAVWAQARTKVFFTHQRSCNVDQRKPADRRSY